MLLKTVHIDNDILQDGNLEENLSLWPFLNYLTKTTQDSGMLIPKLTEDIIRKQMEQFGDINSDNISSFIDVFEVIYHLAKGVPLDKNIKWGLGFPIPDRVFYGTDAFYELVENDFKKILSYSKVSFWDIEFTNKQLFQLVLGRLYNIGPFNTKLRYVKKAGVFDRYYELDIDYTFVEIEVKGEIPKIDLTPLKNKESLDYDDLAPILKEFDLSKFIFSGFTICTIKDYQQEFLTESLQDLVNNLSIYKGADGLGKLNKILRGMLSIEDIQTSFYPILKLNGAPILSTELAKNSVILSDELFYEHYFNQGELLQFMENPTILSFGVLEGLESEDSKLKNSLKRTGISSYVCFPLIHNDNLVGIFEVYSRNGTQLTRNMLVQVQSYYSLMAQLANEIVYSFKNELNNVILHQYTALQPAVEWRFNQVAAEYLGELFNNQSEPEPPKIVFKQVYPFYAAVDVKDSSFLRNKSYRDDLMIRIGYVEELIERAEKQLQFNIDSNFEERFLETKKWISGPNLDHYLLDTLSFFQEDVSNFLDSLEKKHPEVLSDLRECRRKLSYSQNELHSKSQQFENSLQKLNQTINAELKRFNSKVQEIYPSYFESFRTDGIEYDLYVGQSISPLTPFNPKLLRDFRKEQIINISKIGQQTQRLKKNLGIPLETTQLVFIHPNPIDISFREDERRFDVEGSYNIRYQIIKKRIDKALIKNSSERLVKPDTIAIVYSRNKIAKELRACLKEVSELGFIEPEIEELELENLQGISDLKAMRVRIKFEETSY